MTKRVPLAKPHPMDEVLIAMPLDEPCLVMVVSLTKMELDGDDLVCMRETVESAQGWGEVRLARVHNVPARLDLKP